MSDSGRVVHCPACGAALLAVPTISSCNLFRDEIRVTFDPWSGAHKCPR